MNWRNRNKRPDKDEILTGSYYFYRVIRSLQNVTFGTISKIVHPKKHLQSIITAPWEAEETILAYLASQPDLTLGSGFT